MLEAPGPILLSEQPGVRSSLAPAPTVLKPALPGPGIVHVWVGSVDLPASTLARAIEIFSRDELARAARFHFDKDRNRYIAAHSYLRRLLGAYLSVRPHELRFEHNAKGKPALVGTAAGTGVQFNLTHSDSLMLVAVSSDVQVGVDVESIRSLPDAEELVARFFSCRERLKFKSLPQEQRDIAFFNLWTRKEAWLKATGEGISNLLDQVEVGFVPGEPACLDQLPPGFPGTGNWTICDLAPEPGFAAAVATPVPRALVRLQRLSGEIVGN